VGQFEQGRTNEDIVSGFVGSSEYVRVEFVTPTLECGNFISFRSPAFGAVFGGAPGFTRARPALPDRPAYGANFHSYLGRKSLRITSLLPPFEPILILSRPQAIVVNWPKKKNAARGISGLENQ